MKRGLTSLQAQIYLTPVNIKNFSTKIILKFENRKGKLNETFWSICFHFVSCQMSARCAAFGGEYQFQSFSFVLCQSPYLKKY